MRYFDYLHGLTMTNGAFDELFGGPPRAPESPLTQREMDLAASIQVVTEEVVLRMARHVHRETGMREPLPRRRRGAQLRRQRAAAARGTVRAHLDPAGGGRRRRRARRRAGDPPQGARQRRAAPAPRATACTARYLGPAFADDDDRGVPARPWAPSTSACRRDAAARAHRSPARRREGRRLVPGPHGVRPARARRAAASSATRARRRCSR